MCYQLGERLLHLKAACLSLCITLMEVTTIIKKRVLSLRGSRRVTPREDGIPSLLNLNIKKDIVYYSFNHCI